MRTSRRNAVTTFVICFTLLRTLSVFASSTLPLSTAELIADSDAVFRGKVVGITTARNSDGLIYTRTSLRVDEALKGKLPSIVAVEHRGGQVGNEEEFFGLSPKLRGGGEYLLFVKRNANDKLECTQGHASAIGLLLPEATSPPQEYAPPGHEWLTETRTILAANPIVGSDVTDQNGTASVLPLATAGMLSGVNTRFLQPDRGESIPVLIDADSLPAGMTLTQATNAVQKALDAWMAVTSLKLKIESIGGFGQGADTITIPDEKLRLQLHDNYGRINTANTLGIGGRNAITSPSPAGWDVGGNVAGNEFRKSVWGYVVLESGSASMQNTNTFTEVLCHEIGHALNMAHSSEVTTSDPLLLGSIMYYQAHADGRGASLGTYDPPIIQQCYPSNTVPFLSSPAFPLHRVIDATTASSVVNIGGINEVEIRGYDLQTAALTVITNNQAIPFGSIALEGNRIKYTAPVGNYADSGRLDPQIVLGTNYSHYGLIFARLSDGTNASSYTMVRVISLSRDGASPLDGIPDYWMLNFFGNATPQAVSLSRATDNADGDGLNNLQEYFTAMNPKSSASVQKITSVAPGTLTFQAKAYDLYEVMGSTNLIDWTVITPFIPTNASLAVRTSLPQTNIIATVSNLSTANPYMFFRVRKVP